MTLGGPGRPRDPDTGAAILKAALELLVERGADGASFEQIAKRAGVARLTIYRRWSSKEDLLAAAIEWARHDIPDLSIEEAAALPLTELVERALPAVVETVADPKFRALVAATLGSAAQYPKLMATYWQHYVLPRRRIAHFVLKRAKHEGVLAEDTDIDVLIDMIVGAVMYRALQPRPFDAAEIRRYLEAVYRHAGLLPHRPTETQRES